MAKTNTATAAKPAASTTTPGSTPAATAAKTNAPRIAPKLGTVRTDVAIPENAGARGSKSSYPFASLAVGGSFAVLNKSVKALSSIISNQNRKPGPRKTGPDGKPIVKQNPVKDANGNVVGMVPSNPVEYETEPGPKYQAYDVDASTDPDNAPVRVFRIS